MTGKLAKRFILRELNDGQQVARFATQCSCGGQRARGFTSR